MNQQDESNQDKVTEQNVPPTAKNSAEQLSVEQEKNSQEVETAKDSAKLDSPPEPTSTADAELELPDWILEEAPAVQAEEAEQSDENQNAEAVSNDPPSDELKEPNTDSQTKTESAEKKAQPLFEEGIEKIVAVIDQDDIKEEGSSAEPEDTKKHKVQARKMSYPFNKLVANFAGCGRCSYFLAGYRVLQGELVLDKAANRMKLNQLQLPWDEEMRKLLVHSYGIHFDVDFLRFNGSCPECGRPFTYKESMNLKKPNPTFTIQFNFKKRA